MTIVTDAVCVFPERRVWCIVYAERVTRNLHLPARPGPDEQTTNCNVGSITTLELLGSGSKIVDQQHDRSTLESTMIESVER